MGDKNLSMSDCFVAGIRALRDRNWIKKQQKEIAKEIGYTECHLAQVMNGKREPGISLQDMLAKIYGMNAEDVIRIGRSVLEGKGFLPFIGQVEHLPANRSGFTSLDQSTAKLRWTVLLVMPPI